jgi:uncharacterized protein YxeA
MIKKILIILVLFLCSLGIITCGLLLCTTNAEANNDTVVAYGTQGRDYIKTVKTCVNGRLFVIAYTGAGYSDIRGISMVQVFDYKTKPVPCTQ